MENEWTSPYMLCSYSVIKSQFVKKQKKQERNIKTHYINAHVIYFYSFFTSQWKVNYFITFVN